LTRIQSVIVLKIQQSQTKKAKSWKWDEKRKTP
jgi:hypothetical protein